MLLSAKYGMGQVGVQRLVVLSPNVKENREQSSVHTRLVGSEAKVPLGQVRTQNRVAKSEYVYGVDGHVSTHCWVLLSRI